MQDNSTVDINIYKPKLLPFIYSYVKCQATAEDICQDIMIKATQNIHSLREEKMISSWLFAIAKNHSLNYLKRNKTAANCSIPEMDNECSAKNYNEQLLECLPRYIEKIPFLYKEALVMADIELLSHKEIAEKLNISLTAAKSRVQRGRQKLKDELEQGCVMKFDPYGNLVDCTPKKNLDKLGVFF